MIPQKPDENQSVRLLRQLLQQGKRVFTMKDATEAASMENVPHNQLKKILSNLAKQGRILRVRRGLYAVLGLLPTEKSIHPFVIATHLVQPAAISHWSALQHHGLTEQIPQIITASTPNKVVTPSMRGKELKPLKQKHVWRIADIDYEYINVQQKHFFGTEKIWLDEYSQVLITDKERTLLDVFVYPKMFGGMGEALGILENSMTSIDVQKLVQYALQYDKKSITKRLGWALDYFGVKPKQLGPLLKIPISYYCRLDPAAPAIGPYDKHWMIQNNLIGMKNK